MTRPRTGGADARSRLSRGADAYRAFWFPATLFAAVAVTLFVVTRLSVAFLPFAAVPPHPFPDYGWFEGWTRWDTGWYWSIARDGYFYRGPGQQSPVAFFPAYPAAMRLVGALVGDVLVAGVLITYAAGLVAVVAFHRWCCAALGPRTARVAVALLVVYPFSFYLFGAVYSDALFLASAVLGFLFLERDRVWLAALAGAVATAARPVGVALIVGLAIRALELRGVIGGAPPRFAPKEGERPGRRDDRAPSGGRPRQAPLLPRRLALAKLSLRDAPVLLSGLGLALYCGLLWYRFNEPFAFSKVANAPGWSRELTLSTVLKIDFIRLFRDPDLSAVHAGLGLQALLTIAAVLLVPSVIRRLGWGYGAFVVVVVGIPVLTSNNFVGTGRYVLAAFPCFAAAADLVASRHKARVAVLMGSGAALVLMHSLFVRWYFLS